MDRTLFLDSKPEPICTLSHSWPLSQSEYLVGELAFKFRHEGATAGGEVEGKVLSGSGPVFGHLSAPSFFGPVAELPVGGPRPPTASHVETFKIKGKV